MNSCFCNIGGILAYFVLGATGCISTAHVPSSDAYAPMDLSQGNQTHRQISHRIGIDMLDTHYSWVSKSGHATHSYKITAEIDQFLEDKSYLNFPRFPIGDAGWYWAPESVLVVEKNPPGEDELVYGRPDTIVILAINPTIILRIERPTGSSTVGIGSPGYDTKKWWGWSRYVLANGIADGLVIPVVACDDPWPYFTEIIIPSTGFRQTIDLNMPGVQESEIATINWSCVSDDNMKSYIKFDIRSKKH